MPDAPSTDDELHFAVKAYLKMLKYEEEKTAYVKAEINRQTQSSLTACSHKSIEYRWQNISAVLNNRRKPYVNGFKPANNVGSRMEEKIWGIIKKCKEANA